MRRSRPVTIISCAKFDGTLFNPEDLDDQFIFVAAGALLRFPSVAYVRQRMNKRSI